MHRGGNQSMLLSRTDVSLSLPLSLKSNENCPQVRIKRTHTHTHKPQEQQKTLLGWREGAQSPWTQSLLKKLWIHCQYFGVYPSDPFPHSFLCKKGFCIYTLVCFLLIVLWHKLFPTGLRPIPVTSFHLNHLFEDPASKQSPTVRRWGQNPGKHKAACDSVYQGLLV